MAAPVRSHDTRYSKMTDCECQTDDYDPSGDDSDFEGISEPPILRQLKNILDQYPDGSQIIRELVQNAEDAGAKDFKIFFSEVTTDTETTGSYGKYFRGPALCVYNDGVFTDKDWIGIKSIYTSVKEKDALKVGRFGLGFKSVFHITDSPVIISRDRLLVISPLEKPHRVCHTIPFSKLRSIKYKATWTSLKECLENNGNEIFHFSESSVKEQNYPHTLFWFPLRREQSDLSCKMYTKDKMEELFHSFETEASTILLFLKYAIEKALKSVLYTRDADGADRMSKTHDLVSLSLQLKIPEVSDQCRRFPNEVSLLHTNMRYPVNSDSQVPGEKFSVDHANNALEIAECVLEECDNAP